MIRAVIDASSPWKQGNYFMVGKCENCTADNLLIIYSRGDEARSQTCPICGCWEKVWVRRLASDEEIAQSSYVGTPAEGQAVSDD